MSATGQAEILPRARVIRLILWFSLLTALFAGGAHWMIIELGLKRYYVALLMWTPGLAALLACKMNGVGTGILGWHWGPARWHWTGYLLPVFYGLVAYGIIWQAGLGGVPSHMFINEAGQYLGPTGWSETSMIIFGVIMLATVGMIWHLATALGEEIGWRGLLTPQLMRLMPFPLASLVTGLVWSVWHMPLLYFTTYNAGPGDLHIQFANFTLMSVSLSFMMTYLRLKSGSLWPVTVMHAAHNAIVLAILQQMTLPYEDTWRYANEFGYVLPLVTAAFALFFWRRAVVEGLTGRLDP